MPKLARLKTIAAKAVDTSPKDVYTATTGLFKSMAVRASIFVLKRTSEFEVIEQ